MALKDRLVSEVGRRAYERAFGEDGARPPRTRFLTRHNGVFQPEALARPGTLSRTTVTPAQTPAPSSAQTLTLHDLVRYYRSQGVVGEEPLVCGITLAAVAGASFGVEGSSGSGKTFVVDKLVRLLPDVYTVGQASNVAVFHDAERINGSRFLYIPELQKAMQRKNAPIIEVIKDLTEGKDATRLVARTGGGVTTYAIKRGVTLIYTLAAENDFKKDEESSRRFLQFYTDASPAHLDAIHAAKARERWAGPLERAEGASLEGRVQGHVRACLGLQEAAVLDPFAEYIAQVVPKTQKSVAYIDQYYALVDGCVKFHAARRPRVDLENGPAYLVSLEDHVLVHRLYYPTFLQTLRTLASGDDCLALERAAGSEPDWAACLAQGLFVMRERLELAPMRRRNPRAVEAWLDAHNRPLAVQDYVTGQPLLVLSSAPPSSEERYSAVAVEGRQPGPCDGVLEGG